MAVRSHGAVRETSARSDAASATPRARKPIAHHQFVHGVDRFPIHRRPDTRAGSVATSDFSNVPVDFALRADRVSPALRGLCDRDANLASSGVVQRLASPIRVSAPTDPAEREAEDVARRVMAMTAEQTASVPSVGTRIAPTASPALAAPAVPRGPTPAGVDVEPEIRHATMGGDPLPASVNAFMAPRFKADFSRVRIHTDARAAGLAARLQARAFAFGRHIFFARGQFQPDTEGGRALIAHELTHTIQQREIVQRSMDTTVAVRSPTQVQRWSVDEAIHDVTDKAYAIPGFRLMTLVLGVNPITMQPVDRTTAALLRAAVELMPGGSLITAALERYGVFDKAAGWLDTQIRSIGIAASAIKGAVDQVLRGISITDVFQLDEVWARAKRILTAPIDRVTTFLAGLANGLVSLVKEGILQPLAERAAQMPGWALLVAVLGRNPITGEPVPWSAESLIGGFMTFIGQEDVWQNIKQGNAVARCWAWFQDAVAHVRAVVAAAPAAFLAALHTLGLPDLLNPIQAFARVAIAFGGFAAQFAGWAQDSVWHLLEIVFDVVKPGAFAYVKRTGAALRSILKNPIPFVGNLVRAARLGLGNFAGNIGTHLKTGLIDWLTGSLPGVYIPASFNLAEIGKFALSVLGITWTQIRGKIVKALGPGGETIMKGLETTFDVVVALVKGGPAAAWEIIKDKLGTLRDAVLDGIIGFVVETVVKKAIPKLVSMFIPGAGFISAILSIYDTVMVFVQKLSKIVAAVVAFIDSIVAIAAGQVEGAALKLESTLAGLLSLAINFLAGFLGIGAIADKVMGVVGKVRAVVDKALDVAITWVVGKAKTLFGALFAGAGGGNRKDDRTASQKLADLQSAVNESSIALAKRNQSSAAIDAKLSVIQRKYNLRSLRVVTHLAPDGRKTSNIHGEINPVLDGPQIVSDGAIFPVKAGDVIRVPESRNIETIKSVDEKWVTYTITYTQNKNAETIKRLRETFLAEWSAGKIVRSGDMPAAERRKELARLYGAPVADAIMSRGSLATNLAILDASQGHHIIPVELWKADDRMKQLITTGWNPNDVINGIPLAQNFHGAHPAYTAYAQRRIARFIADNGSIPPALLMGPFHTFVTGTLIPELRAKIEVAQMNFRKTGVSLNDFFVRLP